MLCGLGCGEIDGQEQQSEAPSDEPVVQSSLQSLMWNSFGDAIADTPRLISRSAGTVDLVARSTTGAVVYRHYNGSTWGSLTTLSGLTAAGAPQFHLGRRAP